MRDFDNGAQDPAGSSGSGAAAHVVVRGVAEIDAVLDDLASAPGWSMSPTDQAEALLVVHRLQARVEALGLRLLAAADANQVGAEQGATSTAAWLAHETHTTRASRFRQVRLAAALDGEFEVTRAALAAGAITLEHAQVIVSAVDRLTSDHDDLPEGTRGRAEAHLVELAARFDPMVLHRLGKRLFEVVCPEAADAVEGERLAQDEERARARARCSFRDNGDGTTQGWFRLPSTHAEALKKALQALTSPRRIGHGRLDPETGKKLDAATVLGRGLVDLVEHHLNLETLPASQGCPFTVVVTIGIDALLSGLGVATTETGGRLSAGEARRLACQAGIIPMVLGGDSVPLELGREQRLFSKYQRIAMAQRHGGCAAVNCDRPPAWIEAHHTKPWSQGGRTDVDDGIPLCPPHHHMADHPQAWNMRTLPGGGVRFSRRQ